MAWCEGGRGGWLVHVQAAWRTCLSSECGPRTGSLVSQPLIDCDASGRSRDDICNSWLCQVCISHSLVTTISLVSMHVTVDYETRP